jgi:hypothetical protein
MTSIRDVFSTFYDNYNDSTGAPDKVQSRSGNDEVSDDGFTSERDGYGTWRYSSVMNNSSHSDYEDAKLMSGAYASTSYEEKPLFAIWCSLVTIFVLVGIIGYTLRKS